MHLIDRFSAAYDQAGMKSSNKKQGIVSLSKHKVVYAASKWQYTVADREFKYLGVIFTNDGRQNVIHGLVGCSKFKGVRSAVARVSEAPPEISRGAPHTLLAYYYELQ